MNKVFHNKTGRREKQRGSALYFTILILTTILTLGLGLAGILLGEIRITRDVGRFQPAIYAADSGVERALYKIRKKGEFTNCPDTSSCVIDTDNALDNEAVYEVTVVDPGVSGCTAANKCIFSKGTLEGANRALEASF